MSVATSLHREHDLGSPRNEGRWVALRVRSVPAFLHSSSRSRACVALAGLFAAVVSLTAGAADAQASLELAEPRAGARVHAHGHGDHVRLTWRGAGEPMSRSCVAPCALHVERGRWHARYEEIALDADFVVGRGVVVLEPSPRSDLELGVGLALALVGVGVAASAVGADDARCLRGEPCEPWVPGLLVPSAVVLLVGLVMSFDAGGELHATRVSAR